MKIAAVPVKDLVNAKQRLVSVLTADERAALARAMLVDVLTALTGAGLDAIWVVTRDAEVTTIARGLGADVLAEAENRGHTAAVAFAQAEAKRRAAGVFVTVPGDVPCATADELRALAAMTGAPPAVALTPSRSGAGTNGVAMTPVDAMPLRFGEPSFSDHVTAARACGLEPRVLRLPGLGLDIDAPDDLAALLAAGAGTESARLVATWPIAARLARRAEAARAQLTTHGPSRSKPS
ncbi:MAG: 2-phospho-L-lactate guanylyltransferase [Candidatus Rokubacteria bacterium]|nr:2-phospho-L-lactate guanylyltransferase [Candidatus Rokubacteria bacterium]